MPRQVPLPRKKIECQTVTPILADSAAPRSRTQRQSILKQIMGMPAGAIFLVFMTLQIVCIAGALLYPNEFRYLSRRTSRS